MRLKEKVKDAVGLMIHSDGKRQEEFGELKERMPTILSGFSDGTDHLLDIPTVSDGTGKTTAAKISAIVDENDDDGEVGDKLVSVSGDTYSGNRGYKSGQWAELERVRGKPLLKAPCRHHGVDLLPKAAYKEVFGPSKGPTNSDFKKFRANFRKLKPQLKSIEPAINEKWDHPFMVDAVAKMKECCDNVLRDPAVRSDRKEYAQQCLSLNGFSHPDGT